MNVSTAHIQFKIGIDKTDSFNSANFLTEEIDLYLSDAQEEFIEQRAYGNNFKRESLEETQKRVKDLQSITTNVNSTLFSTDTNNKPLGTFVTLPTDYRHSINEEVTITSTDCNNSTISTRVPVKAITHDEYNTMISNPFARPSLNQAYRLPYGRFNNREHFELITQGGPASLVTYHLRYLKNPRKIDKAQLLSPLGLAGTDTMDLSDESYREIIQIAIRNAMGDIMSPGTEERLKRTTEIE